MTYRIHDLATLRDDIKTNATRARELRIEARATHGEERHDLKVDANSYGEETRYPHLAYGYLRGRTIEQMESETTRPDNLPSADYVLNYAEDVFMEGPDAPEWKRTKTTTTPVPDDRGVIAKVLGRPAPEPKVTTEQFEPPSWADFKAMVEADIKQWHARCLTAHTMKLARRAAAKVQKAVA